MLKKYRNLQRSPDGLFSQLFVKPLELILLPLVVRLPISPHVWTILSYLAKLAAGVWMLFGSSQVLVPLWLWLALVLDGFDGDVARWRGDSSFTGAYLDRGLDRIANCFLVSCFLLAAVQMPFGFLDLLLIGGLIAGEVLHDTVRTWVSLTGGLLEGREPLPGWDKWLRARGILPFYAQDSLYFFIGALALFMRMKTVGVLLAGVIWLSLVYQFGIHYRETFGTEADGQLCRRALVRFMINRLLFLVLFLLAGWALGVIFGYPGVTAAIFLGWVEFIGFYLSANYLMSLSALIPGSGEERGEFIRQLREKDRSFLNGPLP